MEAQGLGFESQQYKIDLIKKKFKNRKQNGSLGKGMCSQARKLPSDVHVWHTLEQTHTE